VAAGIAVQLWTVGHGSADLGELAGRLARAGIELVVDVRRFPGSRRHPQFGAESLAAGLAAAGIAYEQAADLGGRRRPDPGSPNTGLRNEAFRAYADWMSGEPFLAAYRWLVERACDRATAVMCAETPWWKCHRRLIADAAVLIDAARVVHLMGDRAMPHQVTENAVLLPPATIVYPGPE